MKGTIHILKSRLATREMVDGKKKVPQPWVVYGDGDDPKIYPFYVQSFAAGEQEKLNDTDCFEAEFEVIGNPAKIKPKSLYIKPKPALKPVILPASSMSERRADSPVLSKIRAISLDAVRGCTLSAARESPSSEQLQVRFAGERREVFASLEKFYEYMKTGFDENKKAKKCILCDSEHHGSGPPQTFLEYYQLDRFPQRVKVLEQILENKRTICTCNGWVFPHPPNNVFRRAEEREKAAIVQTFETAKKKSKQGGVPSKVDKFLELSGKKHAQGMETNQINHLIPKQGGGCPVGVFNLQAHCVLCPSCQMADGILTIWQGQEWNRDRSDRAQITEEEELNRLLERYHAERAREEGGKEKEKEEGTRGERDLGRNIPTNWEDDVPDDAADCAEEKGKEKEEGKLGDGGGEDDVPENWDD